MDGSNGKRLARLTTAVAVESPHTEVLELKRKFQRLLLLLGTGVCCCPLYSFFHVTLCNTVLWEDSIGFGG